MCDYLIANAWRRVEAGEPSQNTDGPHEKAAIDHGGSIEERIVHRAWGHARSTGLAAELESGATQLKWSVLVIAVLTFIVGLGFTRFLPQGTQAQVNVFTMLGLLLLPNALSLALWLGLRLRGMINSKPDRGGVFGIAVRQFFLWWDTRAARKAGASIRATWSEFLLFTKTGRLRISMASHLAWASLLLGMLVSCWWMLTVRQVDFVWGSTLLADAQVQTVLDVALNAVAQFGFTVPAANDITMSRIDTAAGDADSNRRWGIFLLGALLTLALLPRLMAGLIDSLLMWRSAKSLCIDMKQPGFVRLLPVLMPIPVTRAIVSEDNTPGQNGEMREAQTAQVSIAMPAESAWLFLDQEIKIDADIPPPVQTLGQLASHADEQRVLQSLRKADQPWQALLIIAPLALTPDRGVHRQIAELVEVALVPVHLVLVDTTRIASLPQQQVQRRLADWQQLAGEAGIDASHTHRIRGNG